MQDDAHLVSLALGSLGLFGASAFVRPLEGTDGQISKIVRTEPPNIRFAWPVYLNRLMNP